MDLGITFYKHESHKKERPETEKLCTLLMYYKPFVLKQNRISVFR